MNLSTFHRFRLSTRACAVVAALCAATAARAAHVRETMTLAKGWNAVYLESTPTNAPCSDFFAGAPVERVAAYHSDAYSSTRQLADDGTEIAQKPVSYYVWINGDETASTMTSLAGGRVYLVYATADWTSEPFLGVPAAPRQTWRATSGETGFMNLAAVSADTNAAVSAKAYFGEGPFGASGVAHKIGGTNPDAPSFYPMTIPAGSKLQGGAAYALTAGTDGDWPGVIGFSGEASVAFGFEDFAGVTLKNFGTTSHTFRVTIVQSADKAEILPPLMRRVKDEHGEESWTSATNGSWDVELAPDALGTQKFSVDRAKMETGATYAAVMQIEDLGGTRMRVRIPVTIDEKPADEAPFPTGLWAGFLQMEAVSSLTNETPTAAAGTLKMNILVHVDANGKVRLLQRVAAGVDSENRMRLFGDLASAKAACENPRRLSTVMMSVDTPVVEATAGRETFGDQLQFEWVVDANASDNPFRHAWHPDHDGKTADYSGEVASGDDLANYVNPVKPELWSVGNLLYLSWHERNDPTADVFFEHNVEESTAGFATWSVGGLLSGGQINAIGVFYLKRIADVGEIEP